MIIRQARRAPMQIPSDKTNNLSIIEAHNLIAKTDYTNAILVLKETLQKSPEAYEVWLLLSKCLFHTRDYKQAIDVEKYAEQFDPLKTEFQHIQQSMQKKNFANAQNIARQMLKKIEGHPRAIFTLAHISLQTGRVNHAINVLRAGLQTVPSNIVFRQMLVSTLEKTGDYKDAIDEAQSLVNMQNSFDHQWLLISTNLRLGQYNKVIQLCTAAKLKFADNCNASSQLDLVLAQTYRIIGKRALCEEAIDNSLKANPQNGNAWWALADLKTHQFQQSDILSLQSLVNTQTSNSPNTYHPNKTASAFALAKASEKTQDAETIFSLYDKANKSYANSIKLNELKKNITADFSSIKNVYSAEALNITAKQASSLDYAANTIPIFIVGLPRSGSTLVEQILASHTQIEATIEQASLASTERLANAYCYDHYQHDLRETILKLQPNELKSFGNTYINNSAFFRNKHNHKVRFYIDKQPFNFRHIGLLHKILPTAIIIDVKRNPMDCGWSLYKQYFPSGVDFSYDLSTIAHFYNQYSELMRYWDSQLPGKVISIQYEDLVKQPELQIRSLLAKLELEYEQSCLDFHKTNRTVHTASSEQVRQAMNTRGIGTWRSYKDELKPLHDTIEQRILDEQRTYL